MAIVLDGTTGITTPTTDSTAEHVTSVTGFKNRIINGGMVIDQRNAGASVTPTTSGYILDRYQAVLSQGSKLTFQQVSDTSSGAWFTFKATVAAQYSPTATEQFIIRQAIEGFNVNDLFFGGSLAKVITTSMQIKGSVAGTYSVSIANGNSDRSYVGTIAVTTSWTAVSITIIGDTSGTWFDDNRTGMYMAIDLGCGANLKAPTNNAWQAGDYKSATGSVVFVNQAVGSTLSFTNIQLEKGSVATSFDYRPYGTELSLCQRYLPAFTNTVSGTYTISNAGGIVTTTTARITIPFQVAARVPPTGLTTTAASGFFLYNGSQINQSPTAVTLATAGIYQSEIQVTFPAVSAAGQGQFTCFWFQTLGAQLLFTGCEL